MAGNNARRSVPRSNFTIPNPTADRSSLGAGLIRLATTKKENDLKGKEKDKPSEEEEEVYSDPDEGVEIIDMEDVRQMDWMAPESLRKERRHTKKKIKKEEPRLKLRLTLPNALDLSESEEEEEFEDLIEHFARQEIMNEDPTLREDRLYFFQFPSPFPTFVPPAAAVPEAEPEVVDPSVKRDLWRPPRSPIAGKEEESPVIDGIIGSLEVYRSGAVKMRLPNGILLDVTAATQPSFLQHAVCLDLPQKRLTILGEVNKRFVVSPNIDALLE
ncbi:RNA polymerase III RPC4-domain-containing protein [Mycena latifolia]|nr:RNA polymerase III RPC4-domain-containing protein [Mycena latifolia]